MITRLTISIVIGAGVAALALAAVVFHKSINIFFKADYAANLLLVFLIVATAVGSLIPYFLVVGRSVKKRGEISQVFQ